MTSLPVSALPTVVMLAAGLALVLECALAHVKNLDPPGGGQAGRSDER